MQNAVKNNSGMTFARLASGNLLIACTVDYVSTVKKNWLQVVKNYDNPDLIFLQSLLESTGWSESAGLYFVDPNWSPAFPETGLVSNVWLDPSALEHFSGNDLMEARREALNAAIWAYISDGVSTLAGDLINKRHVVLQRLQ